MRIGSKFFNKAFPSSSVISIPNYLRANLNATGSTMPFYSIALNATLKALRPLAGALFLQAAMILAAISYKLLTGTS